MATFRERPYANRNFLVDLGTGEEERKREKEGSNLLLAFNPYMASLPVPGGSQNIPSVQVRVETSNSE